MRSQDESGTLGNKVAMWLLDLPIAEPDPAKRVQKINRETKNLKEADHALGASTLVEVSTGAPATLLSLAARLASRARPFNMTVTNVPGPQFPLYGMGAELVANYPVSTITDGSGLNITVQSDNGNLDFGIIVDRDLVPDVWDLAEMLHESMDELLTLA